MSNMVSRIHYRQLLLYRTPDFSTDRLLKWRSLGVARHRLATRNPWQNRFRLMFSGKTASLTVRHCTQSAKMDSLLLLYIASRVLFTSVPLLDLAIRRYYAPRASYSNADLEFDAQHTKLSYRPPPQPCSPVPHSPFYVGCTMMLFLFTNDRREILEVNYLTNLILYRSCGVKGELSTRSSQRRATSDVLANLKGQPRVRARYVCSCGLVGENTSRRDLSTTTREFHFLSA